MQDDNYEEVRRPGRGMRVDICPTSLFLLPTPPPSHLTPRRLDIRRRERNGGRMKMAAPYGPRRLCDWRALWRCCFRFFVAAPDAGAVAVVCGCLSLDLQITTTTIALDATHSTITCTSLLSLDISMSSGHRQSDTPLFDPPHWPQRNTRDWAGTGDQQNPRSGSNHNQRRIPPRTP